MRPIYRLRDVFSRFWYSFYHLITDLMCRQGCWLYWLRLLRSSWQPEHSAGFRQFSHWQVCLSFFSRLSSVPVIRWLLFARLFVKLSRWIIEWASEPVRSFSIICREAEDRARLRWWREVIFNRRIKKTANDLDQGIQRTQGRTQRSYNRIQACLKLR